MKRAKNLLLGAALAALLPLMAAAQNPPATQPGSGQPKPGQTNPGQVNPAQPKPGQTNPGQTKPGQVNPGQVNPTQPGTPKVGTLNNQVLMQGLATPNLGNMQFKANDLVNINTAFNNAQLQAYLRDLNANQQAMTASQQLNQRLRTQGILRPNERVIGFANGRVYTTGNVNGTIPGAPLPK